MKKIVKLVLMAMLVFSVGFTTLPEKAGATDYCASFSSTKEFYELSRVMVEHGDTLMGACHIQKYHMYKVGAGSAIVEGQSKSQFSRSFTHKEMAQIAGGVVAMGKNVAVTGTNKYKAEYFDISLNQNVRVIYVKKMFNSREYKSVITMYPISKIVN